MLANIGGTIGLFVGFSLVSVVELIVYVVDVLFKFILCRVSSVIAGVVGKEDMVRARTVVCTSSVPP